MRGRLVYPQTPGITNGNKKLLGTKSISTSSKKLLVAPGIATRVDSWKRNPCLRHCHELGRS